MTEFRYCKFKDGSIKYFEDILAGDVFQVFEPDGTFVCWFRAASDYDGVSGFTGVILADTTNV